MAKFGLPTYPISDGMILGNRDAEEIEWLLDHGVIQSDIYHYLKVIKINANEYRLVKMQDDRYATDEQTVCGASSLEALVEMEHLSIEYWYWYPVYEN